MPPKPPRVNVSSPTSSSRTRSPSKRSSASTRRNQSKKGKMKENGGFPSPLVSPSAVPTLDSVALKDVTSGFRQSSGGGVRSLQKQASSGSGPTVTSTDSAAKRATSRNVTGEAASPPKELRSFTSDNIDALTIPSEEQLLKCKRLHTLSDQLARSLLFLRDKLTKMEKRIQKSESAAILPFQIRRAKLEKAQLENEIEQTTRTINKLSVMIQQMEHMIDFRDIVFEETKNELENEIAELQTRKKDNGHTIRDGYIDRINLLQRYWPWRQLLELGDTTVGATFAEELSRGPRYRHVGIQNVIQSDYIEQQLKWLEEFVQREEAFRTQLRQLDTLVEDLNDINDLLESTLTCTVCGLLFDEPVVFWPCGHTFCVLCFDSLMIAPSLYRCPICGSVGSEGYVHNLLIAETVAKWMFKDAGYGDLQKPLNSIRLHLSRFRNDRIESRVRELRELMQQHKLKELERGAKEETITISYRAY